MTSQTNPSPTPFIFDEHRLKPSIPTQVLLDSLRTFVQLFPKHRKRDFNSWPDRPCNAHTICLRFKGWRRGLWAAGHTSARRGKYSRSELMDLLEQTWRQIGRAPGHMTLLRVARVSGQNYTRHWGSLARARARLARYMRKEITRSELLAPIAHSHPKRLPIRPSTRYHVFQRDHHRCQLCGASPKTDPTVILEIDHINPISNGGDNSEKNLRTLCQTCNRGKRDTLEAA